MNTNFHTHTYRCKHASGTELEYAKAAVRKNISILGFSDHAPFPDYDFGLRMDFSEINSYISKIDEAKEILGDKIKIYKGLEIEYHQKYIEYYKELKTKYGFEYLILGEHLYTVESGEIKNIAFAKSTEDFIDYANALCQGIESGLFDIAAHPDIMFKIHLDWDKNCDRACEMILSCAEKHNFPLEYNANGLRRGLQSYPDGIRYPYPHEAFWNRIKGSKIPIIIGSDAHITEQIRDRAVIMAEEITYKLNLNVINNIFG